MPTQPTRFKPILMTLCVAMTLALAACGKEGAPKAAGQVLARVNDQEITVLQLNAWLAQHPPAAGEDSKLVQQRALEALIEQEVLVQKARKMKLDHDPDISLAIDMTQRQILATSAASKLISNIPAADPTPAEMQDFYIKHPQWFGERRLYNTVAIVVPSETMSNDLNKLLEQSKSPDATLAILNANRVEYRTMPLQLLPERLPLELQPVLFKLQPGDIMTIPAGASTTLVQLVGTEPAPVSVADADPAIRGFMVKARTLDNARKALFAIKKDASISYVRRFTDPPVQKSEEVSSSFLNTGLKGLQ